MYESIPKELRTMEADSKRMEPYKRGLLHRATRAIEDLSMKLHGDEAAIAGMKREIERMVVAGKPRWIPVTERLPLYGDWVLGIGPKKGYHVCEFRGITHFPYSGDIPWFTANGRSFTITHWMPLPEPPKEET